MKGKTLDLFVYGTLRPGFELASLLEPATLNSEAAYVHDFSMYLPHGWNFPIAVHDENGSDFIVGDLLTVKVGDEYWQTVAMEIRAGYHVARVWANGARRGLVPANLFAYEEVPERAVQIDSGDWSDAEFLLRLGM